MTSRRVQKAAEAIREVVSMAILADLKDPRVRDVTVTAVEVSPDMRQAKIHVSVMGDETRQNLSLRGLQNAAGFLQSKVAKRIETRYTPRLTFMLDLGVKRSIEIAQILNQVLSAGQAPVGPDSLSGPDAGPRAPASLADDGLEDDGLEDDGLEDDDEVGLHDDEVGLHEEE
jgi:ribosome-binding factor A